MRLRTMLSSGRSAAQSGLSAIGGLLIVLFLGILVYFGAQLAPMWLNYYEMLGHMEAMGDRASVKTDKEIREFLEDQIRKMELPLEENKGLRMQRTGGTIALELRWEEVVYLDLGGDYYWELWVFDFHPKVKRVYSKKRR